MLVLCLSIGLTACVRTKVIDPNTTPVRMPAGQPTTPAVDGYFVPDATMLRILDRAAELDVWGTNTTAQ